MSAALRRRFMPVKVHGLLVEALRRYTRFGIHEGKTLDDANTWTGLGTAVEYREVEALGYMQHGMTWDGRDAGPRQSGCMGWWALTAKGAAIVSVWLGMGFDFQKIEAGENPPVPFDYVPRKPTAKARP